MTAIRPPKEVAPLVALIGEAATLALLEHYAGTRVQIPARVTERSALARAIGLRAARRLGAEMAGTKLSVPLAKRWRILHLRQAGLSYAALARRVGTTESVVYRTLADHGMTDQLTLGL